MDDGKAKQRFFAIAKIAAEVGGEPDWDVVSKELDVPTKLLYKWMRELNKLNESQTVLDILDTDAQMVDEIAEHVAEKTSETASGPKIELVNGVIQVTSKEAIQKSELREQQDAKVASFKHKTEGLKLLNEEVQGAAGSIVTKIVEMSEYEDLTVKDLSALTIALTSIQNSFFNKPTTNIQVNAINGEGQSLLSNFRERLNS